MSEIVVVGGGIGGLATALAVARHGHWVTVLERSAEFAELGAGIQLAPNGIAALDRLGLGQQVRDAAVFIDELRFMDGVTGRHVVSMPLTGGYRRRFGNPYVVVHRGDLYRALLDACREHDLIRLRPNATVARYTQDGWTATVELDSGEWISGDAVVGADGIHSAIRAQLVGDGPPRISGITVYRAIIPMEQVPAGLRSNDVTWWAGPGCHFVHYPIGGGTYLNLAASNDNGATAALAGVPVEEAFVHQELSGLGEAAHELLALGHDWRSWVLVDRDPVPSWTDGRVVLLGDAAHAMLHYAAQGACMALEDAVVLGDLLDCGPAEFGSRFEKYAGERRDRTARVTLLARDSIRLWHPAGPAAQRRNAALAAMSADDLHDHVAWMHGGAPSGHADG